MFWQQLNLEDSMLNDLVTKEDTTLDRVLEESDVIQECKTKNEKLLEFLSRIENMHQLIDYIIFEPQNDDDEKTKFYKPYVCCELLSSDASIITDTLANDSILLLQLWSFIRTREEINPLLASFFSKVVQILLNRRPNVVLAFLKDHPSLIDDLVFHIDTSAVMDVIYRVVICFENSITRFKVCHWLRDVRLIDKLVSSIKDDASNDSLCNACQLLSDIIKVCRDPQESFKGAKDALLIELEGEHTIQKIITSVISSKNKHLINHGISILQTYLTKQSSTSMVPNMMVEVDKPSIVNLEPLNKCISENWEDLQALLYSTETGVRPDRLQVIKLITSLVQCYSPQINRELVRLKTLENIWKLFLENSYNNFLHTQVVSIIEHILNTKVSSHEDGILLHYLIWDMQLMRQVEEVWEENSHKGEVSKEGSRKRRVGYLGHLYRIAGNIQDVVVNKENKKYFEEWLESQDNPLFWNTFYEETLKDQRIKNESDLGPDPRRFNHMDSDEDNEDKIGIGLNNIVSNPLFSWKPDDEEDAEFSFEPAASNNFAQMDFKPVITPDWKDKSLDEYWEKNITFSEPDQTSSMQVQEGSSSSEEEEEEGVKEVQQDPWASAPQQEFNKMDTDVSWANFNDFEPDEKSETRERWESTPPEGTVLHASPKTPTSEKKSKYGAPGSEYTLEDMPTTNGMMSCEDQQDGENDGVMITESSSSWPATEITS